MKLTREQGKKLLDERVIWINEACDRCGKLLGSVRWTRRGEPGLRNPQNQSSNRSSNKVSTPIPPAGTDKLGRHKRYCKICSHENRQEIEQDFITWKSPIAIAKEYGLADRMNVYRHATALGLFEKRRRNIRAALEVMQIA